MELVPPGCHCRNIEEVTIQNFKAHFLSVLAGVAEDFPPSLWDRLLPQTEMTLNVLGQSNATPTVSAYAHLCVSFDYNKMPLTPMGCAVQVHKKTDTFRLDKSVPTTTLLPLVPRSTRLLTRTSTTLTKNNLLSSITISQPHCQIGHGDINKTI